MGRTKGAKNIPKIIVTEEYKDQFMLAHGNANNLQGLTKLEIKDREYLLHTLILFERALSPKVPKYGVAHGNCRYQPMELFNTVMQYFYFTVDRARPLTLSGIGLFCGFSKGTFQDICQKHDDTDPHWGWLKKCIYFVEMYMEYTAQMKVNPAFQIFWLKNRGWVDKLEIEAKNTPGAMTDEEREIIQKRIAEFSEK